MKKLFFTVITLTLILIIIFSMSSCILAKEKVILKCGHVLSADHPNTLGLLKAAEIIKEKTDGYIELQVFPLCQLGPAKDMIQSVILGTQQMGLEGGGMLGLFVPTLSIMECPYVFKDREHMLKVMKGSLGQQMANELLEKKGLRLLEFFYNGNRHVTTTNTPANKPEDLNGLLLRVPAVKLNIAYGNALGAKATSMPFPEVYMALKQGVIDGQENPFAQINSAKFYEVQKYLILTGHVMAVMMVYINEDIWQNFSPKEQEIIKEALAEGRKYSDNLVLEGEKDLLKKFKEQGMTIIEPDVDSFRKACSSVVSEFESKWGKGLYENIQAVE